MKQRIIEIINYMKAGTFERDEVLALSLLGALSAESIFLLGLPGVGKSMVARKLKAAFKDARVFEYLMSRFSTPDEIFGPVSIAKLKDEDCYERVTSGYLPEAEIVFLDEIWKAGPAIQNSLLTVLNERIYLNGNTEMNLPLKAAIAASNELPTEGEGLEALWDRFLIRYIVKPIDRKENFLRLIDSQPLITPQKVTPITDDEYFSILKKSRNINVPENIFDTIYKIRLRLSEKVKTPDNENEIGIADNKENLKYYVSDRRWKKAVGILRTSAYLNDRKEVDFSDLLLLCHILWNEDGLISEIRQIVSECIIETGFGNVLAKYKSDKRHANVKNDNRLYSPDKCHYIILCDDNPLKLKITDYEQMRANPKEIFFASETADNRIIFRSSGQYAIRFVKEGLICINNYNYSLQTVADNQLSLSFVVQMNDHIDIIANNLLQSINQNIFTNNSDLHIPIKATIDIYRQRIKGFNFESSKSW